MTKTKEIGTVIEETNYSDNGTITMKRKISVDGAEYNIVPLRCGDYINNPENVEEDTLKLAAEMKAALLKHIEKYIDIQIIHNEALNTLGVKAEITILSKKENEA